MPQHFSSSEVMFPYAWLISVCLKSCKNSSSASLCRSNLLSPSEEEQVSQNKVPQLVSCWSRMGWAFAAALMPAFGSAWDSHRTSDSAGRDLEHQGLSLTRFEITVGLKRKVCILSLPHFPLTPSSTALA